LPVGLDAKVETKRAEYPQCKSPWLDNEVTSASGSAFEASSSFSAPGLGQRLREFTAPITVTRLVVDQTIGRRRGARGSQPILLFPGLAAGSSSMAPLRSFLRRCGHDARHWDVGFNHGDVRKLLDASVPTLERTAAECGTPVGLVGWSLGGVVARELARDLPELVSKVVTFGTPLSGPRNSIAERRYSSAAMDEIEREIAERSLRFITRPVMSIYSRNDGVVDWRSCIDRFTPGVVHHEVRAAHLSLGIDPDVWHHVAEFFAD
jgi:hypothetical protein